ncbi:MAG: PAS domain S-box protein [Chromatiales bacterium]|nr:PAS domain S-box protein [Chromatiales bacterium]
MKPAIQLPLAARITLVLLAVIAVSAAGLGWFGQQVVLDKFAETEMELVLQNRTILDRVIASEVEHLQAIATDWGQWDDLYEFVRGTNPEFQTTELGNVVLDRLELDVILILEPDGGLYYGDLRPDSTGAALPSGPDSADGLATLLTGTSVRGDVTHPPRASLLPKGHSRETIAGLLDTPRGPMVLALRAVSRTDGSGDAAGTLVMGRYLHAEELFTELSVLPSHVIPHGSGREPMSDDMHVIARDLVGTPSGSRLVTRRDDMSDFKIFGDLAGNPAFMLETRMPRSVVATGRATAQLLLVGVLVTAALTILILIALIRGLVSVPLRRLTNHMLALREGGEMQPTPGLGRNDEIGTLARRFDELVSARQRAQARLEIFAAAVEHAGDAIGIMDADGRITYVNPQYERQTGFSAAEVIGHVPSRGQSSPGTYDELWQTVRAGRIWSGRLQTTRRDGAVCDEEVTVAPITDAGGKIASFIAVMHDVTERLRLEGQLSQAHRLEAVGQLAAGVAHEINTPTQYVGGNIRFLRDAFTSVTALLGDIARLVRGAGGGAVPSADLAKILAAADVDYLQAEVPVAIRQSLEGVERVGEIVKSMRELTHPARDTALTDLNRVVESAVRVAGSEWQGIAAVSTELDPGLPLVPCLAGGINQVIVNMLVNAAHAIEARGPGQPGRILVATRQAGDAAEIRITDNGSGMSGEVRARVFDPFFTTKQVGQGTGQGLAIAHSVVKKHHGTIVVDSEPGRGTTFTIRLPLGSAQAGHFRPGSAPAASGK